MTITTQAVRELVDKLIPTGLVEYRTGELSRLPAECIAMLLALVEERDRLYARLEMVEAYDGEGNRISVEPYSIPDGIEARDATIRLLDDRVKALTARAEAAEAALREGSLPWRPMTSLDLHEAYEAHGPYCALMFHDGHFAMPCDPHTLLDQDIEGTLWVTVDEIPPPSAALQGRDGDA